MHIIYPLLNRGLLMLVALGDLSFNLIGRLKTSFGDIGEAVDTGRDFPDIFR